MLDNFELSDIDIDEYFYYDTKFLYNIIVTLLNDNIYT